MYSIINPQSIIYIAFMVILLLLLAIVLLLYFFQLRQKNRIIVKYILEQNRHEQQLGEPAQQPNKDQKLFKRLNEYMQLSKTYRNENVSRHATSRHLSTNERYLEAAVKACANMPFVDYVNILRLQYACNLLSNSHKRANIERIANECGFGKKSEFCQLFIQKYGISPTKFRKNAKNTEIIPQKNTKLQKNK
ncbi:MAG: helix-turn-helix domain-containing protein [Bacteroidales bacterium]|jgi:AraC-like DNA-binding protein|nr:helix-turn-helix domain-containing protein [Bacteroidales bacterium]